VEIGFKLSTEEAISSTFTDKGGLSQPMFYHKNMKNKTSSIRKIKSITTH